MSTSHASQAGPSHLLLCMSYAQVRRMAALAKFHTPNRRAERGVTFGALVSPAALLLSAHTHPHHAPEAPPFVYTLRLNVCSRMLWPALNVAIVLTSSSHLGRRCSGSTDTHSTSVVGASPVRAYSQLMMDLWCRDGAGQREEASMEKR